MTQRIKVSTAELTRKVEAFVAREEAKLAESNGQIQTETITYREAVRAAVEATLSDINQYGTYPEAKFNSYGDRRGHVDIQVDCPVPRELVETTSILNKARKTLEMLRITSEPTQVIATDSDWVAYL